VEFKSTLNVPFDLIARFAQRVDPATGGQRIELDFTREMVIPVPFSILFYHPGSISLTRVLVFDVTRSTLSGEDAGGDDTTVGPVFFLSLSQGRISVDLDAWLKALFSAHLDDAWVTSIAVFTWHGDRVGMLEGTGRSTGRVMRTYFDFTKNVVLFPTPDSLKSVGRRLASDPTRQ
jgi:hypothetical protein